jgi:hypothetical protein
VGHRDFTRSVEAAGTPKRPAQGPSFDLHGVTYHCVPVLPGVALANVVSSAGGSGPEQMKAAMDFLDLALEDESAQKLAAAMRRKEAEFVVELPLIMDIFAWLVEEYGENPSTGSNGSAGGPVRTGRGASAGRAAAVSAR